MKVGLVSDLHRQLPTVVMKALQGVDRILCAGDIEVEPILWELQTIAPVTAVKGNNDYGIDLPLSTTFTLEGVRFFMVHRPQDIGTPADDVAVVVHGHTHIPRNEVIGGVHYINPGSPSYPRGGSDPSVAILILRDSAVERVEFISVGEYEKMPPRQG